LDYYQTHDEIDEIGEGLIRKYQYQSFIQGTPTDIEGFITSNLGYRIVYDRIAEGDAGKMAFLADGKTALLLWRKGQRVYDRCGRQSTEDGRSDQGYVTVCAGYEEASDGAGAHGD